MLKFLSMERILDALSEFHHRVFGDKSLDGVDKLCLDAWRDTLNAPERSLLALQLEQLAYIQRQGAGLKVCFFYFDEAHLPLFPDTRPDVNVATVVLESADAPGKRMKVKIFTHRGRFFSIEFPKRPERYMELHGMKAATLTVQTVITHPAPDPALRNPAEEP